MQNVKNMKKNEKDIFYKINKMAILSNQLNKEPIIHIRFSINNFDYNILSNFMKLVLHHIPLKGVNKIKDTIIAQSRNIVFDEDGNDKVVKEQMVVTSGINIEMLKNFKGIDNTRTSCNDIVSIYKLYGIEAARNCLFYEFQTTFGSGGSGVNYNHLSTSHHHIGNH